MIFNEFRFLVLFLPIVLIAFFLLVPPPRRRELLLFASLFYYGFSGLDHMLVLISGIIWVYLLCRNKSIIGNPRRLAMAVTGPALALIYYKYSTFILHSVLQIPIDATSSQFSVFENVLLPAGISFFTFQLISFAIDRYRGSIIEMPPLRSFALYISFFPQLVAGPILRYDQVEKPIANLAQYVPSKRNFDDAIAYIVFGLMIKVLLADGLARMMPPMLMDPAALDVNASLYVLLGYSFQIYFDFYGYSMIAIGLGRFFGFRLPDNFLRPYEALNPQDFWRRWHVSLSYWIRDYLYLPLGGNRRYSLNIAIVFALCGLWHGAGWNFVVWGLYHGALVGGYSAVAPLWNRMPDIIQRVLNFSLVSLGWLLFLFDFNQAADLLYSLFALGQGTIAGPGFWGWALVGLSFIVCFGFNFERLAAREWHRSASSIAYSALVGFAFFVTLLFIDLSQSFIYFRF
jgi:alginate O-acetyltransferase complex protein AlgI